MKKINQFKYLNEQITNMHLNEAWKYVAAAGLGAWLLNIIKTHRDKVRTCSDINDPLIRMECTVKIINSTIAQLKSSTSRCEKVDNPAKCKLELIKKEELLLKRRNVLNRRINELKRSRQRDDLHKEI